MPQVIAITVKDKIASTDFTEVVSFNNTYRLSFTFDEEWSEYSLRVAVVQWAGGCAEQVFTGTECTLPAVIDDDCDSVLIGVYSSKDESRLASSFVRLSCRAGAHGVPSQKEVASLHDQILALVNEKNWTVFDDKVAEGVYSSVRVNAVGLVTEGRQLIEIGGEGQSEAQNLAEGGIFYKRTGSYFTAYYKAGDALNALKTYGRAEYALTVGSKTYDGSAAVTVTASDLSLATVATSGSYNDLTNKPTIPNVNLLSAYPVGSIYISYSSTSPATLFGGSWTQLTAGRFLVAAGTGYTLTSTGGEATVTLTESQMPAHRHLEYIESDGAARPINSSYGLGSSSYGYNLKGSGNSSASGMLTESTGGSAAHNNLPPYMAVNMWRRTA